MQLMPHRNRFDPLARIKRPPSPNRVLDRTHRLFILEDDQLDRLIAHQHLQRSFPGLSITSMSTGAALIEALEASTDTAVIVLDLGLPQDDAFEVMVRIADLRASGRVRGGHVIVLTGQDVEDIDSRCRALGALAVLSKNASTADYNHLISAIEIVIKTPRQS